jgi:hypothetical protein
LIEKVCLDEQDYGGLFEWSENATMIPRVSMPWAPFGILCDHTLSSP